MVRLLKIFIVITLTFLISGCVTQSQVIDSYSKGSHPIGKHDYKVKRYEKRKVKHFKWLP